MTADDNRESDERRGSQRYVAQHDARLLFIASLEPEEDDDDRSRPKLIGQTRDISETGLSLVASTIHAGDFESFRPGSRMKLKLSIPSGVVEMEGKLVRGEWLEEDEPRERYLMAVRITGLSGDDRVRFSEYLETLK